MAGSPFITIPDPKADLGSVIAAVFALKHDVNLLIVNAQTVTPTASLTGATMFSKIEKIDQQLISIQNQLAVLTAKIGT